MNKQSYTQTITTHAAADKAQAAISDVHAWWAKNFEGKASDADDIFTVRFGSGDMFQLKVAEVLPNERIVWDVIDAHQSWVKQPTEWVGTKIIWELEKTPAGTTIHFTHEGLVPSLECFSQCQI